MKQQQNEEKKKKHLQDLQTVKEMLIKIENRSIIEPWGFFTWGFLIIAGSIVHIITVLLFGFKILDLILKVWLPVIILGGFFESVAYIIRMNKESLPFWSKSGIKYFFSFFFMALAFAIVSGILLKVGATQYLSIIILIFCGIIMGGYALIAFTPLLVHGIFLICISGILFLVEAHNVYIDAAAGFILGLVFIAGGLTVLKCEKT